MNILTKPITEINYDDVVSFCSQGIREGINLDYKQDFPPSGLEKTISAFGNTFGGTIVIGIQDEDSKPKLPYKGIDYKEGLEERVWNIILDNVYPPIFPEVVVCSSTDGKTFVVIRIPQSNETPHAIYNNKQVYVRTGNRNKPEDLATVEQIEWLINRRKKSEDMRELFYRRAGERYQNICRSKKAGIDFAEFTLSFAPLYPKNPLMSVENIRGICEEIKVVDIHRDEFPHIFDPLTPVQNGMASFFLNERSKFISYTEINYFGLVYLKQDFGHTKESKDTNGVQKQLPMAWIITKLDLALEAMAKFYDKGGYRGLVEIKLSLEKLLGIDFLPLIYGREFYISETLRIDNEQELSWKFVLSVAQLNDPMIRQEKVISLGKDIAWSFGFENSIEGIKKFLKERKRWVEKEEEKTKNK